MRLIRNNHYPDLLKFSLRIDLALAPLQTPRERGPAGSLARASLTHQLTGGGQHLQPVFRIVSQASIALCLSIRRRVIGSGGQGGTQL